MWSTYLDKWCVLLYHVRTNYVASFMLSSHGAQKALTIMTIFWKIVL